MLGRIEHTFYSLDVLTVDPDQSRAAINAKPLRPPIYRWECGCRRPPVLLATFDLGGRIAIASPDRYWQVDGRAATSCPKCGKQHVLQLKLEPELLAALPRPWREDRR